MQRTLLKYEKDKRTRGQMDRQTERQTETESKREGEGHATDRKDICKLHGLKHVSQLQRRLTLTHTQQIKLK